MLRQVVKPTLSKYMGNNTIVRNAFFFFKCQSLLCSTKCWFWKERTFLKGVLCSDWKGVNWSMSDLIYYYLHRPQIGPLVSSAWHNTHCSLTENVLFEYTRYTLASPTASNPPKNHCLQVATLKKSLFSALVLTVGIPCPLVFPGSTAQHKSYSVHSQNINNTALVHTEQRYRTQCYTGWKRNSQFLLFLIIWPNILNDQKSITSKRVNDR